MTEHTPEGGRLRRGLSRLTRAGDIPVVVMLAWAGWLAVPWSFSGLAQARAAAAAAADPSPPPLTYGDAAQASTLPYGDAARTSALEYGAAPRFGAVPGQAVFYEDAASDRVGELIARERARIAGEVHDAAGHGLAAIAMQAGVALLMLEENPEQARASLEAIRDTSTEALGRLRAALDVMDPQSGRIGKDDGELARLIDGVRAAGLAVDVQPASLSVPAHLQGTVFRVLRESLTNVLRHAGPTTALVRVANDPGTFVLEVADHGKGWSGSAEGRGVSGMRAHVTAAGGDFTAGPGADGGFRVVARFPQTTPDA